MTIGIACICYSGSALIIAADRMFTIKHRTRGKYAADTYIEGKHRKIVRLTPKCVMLTSGTMLAQQELLNDVISEIRSLDKPSISTITGIIKRHFAALRIKPIKKRLFKRYGLNLEDLLSNKAKLETDIVSRLNRQLEIAKFDLDLLIAGVDQTGAHIFHVFDPGKAECLDNIGYGAIGRGKEHAVASLQNKYSKELATSHAVQIVFEAKRDAQQVPGVGRATDIGAIAVKSSLKYLVAEDMISLGITDY